MMTPHEKNQLLRLIQLIPTTTRCDDCMSHNSGSCIKWDITIPKENLESGCEAWTFNEQSIPL